MWQNKTLCKLKLDPLTSKLTGTQAMTTYLQAPSNLDKLKLQAHSNLDTLKL